MAKRARASYALLGYAIAKWETLEKCKPWSPWPWMIVYVEGAELKVPPGASEVLRRSRLILVCEVGDAKSTEASTLLRDAGHELFDGRKPSSAPARCSHAPWNTSLQYLAKNKPFCQKDD